MKFQIKTDELASLLQNVFNGDEAALLKWDTLFLNAEHIFWFEKAIAGVLKVAFDATNVNEQKNIYAHCIYHECRTRGLFSKSNRFKAIPESSFVALYEKANWSPTFLAKRADNLAQITQKGFSATMLGHQTDITKHQILALYERAAAGFKQEIARGHSAANVQLAYVHQQLGNEQEAIACYLAVIPHNAEAMTALANIYSNSGNRDQETNPSIITYYDNAIALNHAEAMYRRALLYRSGKHESEIDYSKALELLKNASDLDYKPAIELLLRLYLEEQNTITNCPKILALARKDGKKASIEDAMINYLGFLDQKIKGSVKLHKIYKEVDFLQTDCNRISHTQKGKLLASHAQSLKDTMEVFLVNSILDKGKPSKADLIQFMEELKKTLHERDELVQKHRKSWKPILVNLLIASTGVGAILLLVRLCIHLDHTSTTKERFSFNKVGLFSQTQTQQNLNVIDKEIDSLSKELRIL